MRPRYLKKFKKLALGTTVALIGLAGLADANAKEPWEIILRHQLKEEKRCMVSYFVRLREFELAGKKGIEARVHCTDGREFDVVRRDKGEKFEIKLCSPVVC